MRYPFTKLYLFYKGVTFSLKLPSKKDVLIFDRVGSKHLLHYINEKDVEIMSSRGEDINLLILIYSFFTFSFQKKNSIFFIYCINYIKFVNPRVVITFIDNNINYWLFKNYLKDTCFVIVQNGIRGMTGDVFDSLINTNTNTNTNTNYFVDHMLLMGNLSSELYKRYVNGMTHNIGSLVNNMCHRKVNCIYDVIFVLQFKNIGRDKEYRYRNASGKKITWDDCYKYNDKILRFLHKFCLKNGLKLSILGRGKTQFEQIEEQKYIQEIIPNANIKYLASMQQCESYTLLLQSQIVVVLESTMGYEMLARGKRVAYLGVREKTLDKSSRFGWPSLPKKGPFWTNINEEFEFERVLNFTVSSSDKEWNESCNKYIGNIMEYDSGNGNFLSIMKELGVPLKKEFVD